MWTYDISREEFEQAKDIVEDLLQECGAKKISIDLPYVQKSVSFCGDNEIEWTSHRAVYEYNNQFYRVDEMCFDEKPYIVIEAGSYNELMNNIMEDTEPFPYDLSLEEIKLEVEYSLEIKEYPPDY